MSTERNKTFIRQQIEEVWNGRQREAIAKYWDEALGEEIRQSQEVLFAAFPDLQINAEELIAEEDKVVARLRFRGTQLGPFFGISPTGKRIEWEAARIWRLAEGKIVETWAVRDRLHVRQQLGAAPVPAQG